MSEPATKTISADEYYLDDEMFDGNDEQIDGLKDRLRGYRDAVQELIANWEQGDLAAAVRALGELHGEIIDVPIADIPRFHPMFDGQEDDDPDYDDQGNLKPGVDHT